ncbi:hypothetical protein [Demequina litorisediminis]|uniref:Uncharacterized protein n=1 Tax=Demequina litorisediminis TaxID=1849022 RepID=A0ABQ6IBN4_9MICO|nr:hypothetical protein [Demequina litorisediminis]GMA35200.1 hypothetical protein GCM10025876_14040 [Demequina litorisediminis]
MASIDAVGGRMLGVVLEGVSRSGRSGVKGEYGYAYGTPSPAGAAPVEGIAPRDGSATGAARAREQESDEDPHPDGEGVHLDDLAAGAADLGPDIPAAERLDGEDLVPVEDGAR